jgi:hypothetical protein
VRFELATHAAAALGRAEGGKLQVAGYEAAVRVLEGDEELEFMKKAEEARKAKAEARDKQGGGRGGGRGRGGRGGRGRGGKRGRHN